MNGSDISTVIIAIFTVASGLAAIFIAWFNWQLVNVTRDLHQVTEAALHVNRPFLLVTNVVRTGQRTEIVDFATPPTDTSTTAIQVLNNPSTSVHFLVELRNFGVGPADIKDYFCEADIYDPPNRQNGMRDPVVIYQDSECNRLNNSLIAPDETVNDRLFGSVFFSSQQRKLIINDARRIAIHGRIRYRGAPDFTYVTHFFWWYFWDTDSCYRANTEKLNSHT